MIELVESFLERLERVRRCGRRGWTARCPAHDDRSASLSVAYGSNGAILLHCFAGCSASDVVGALGMQMSDLYPPRETKSMSRGERELLRQEVMRAKWSAALDILVRESTVMVILARKAVAGHNITKADLDRAAMAETRIYDARQTIKTKPFTPRSQR